MKECPTCRRFFPDQNSFCSFDGLKLIRSVQNTDELQQGQGQRQIPPPPKPVPLRVTIIDQSDEGHRSRKIEGLALDFGKQGMRIQTGTIETGQLHIIRDHTVAFKNKLAVEVESVRPTGSEIEVDVLAVGHRRRRGVAAFLVIFVINQTFVNRAFPKDLATLAIDGQHHQFVAVIGAF